MLAVQLSTREGVMDYRDENEGVTGAGGPVSAPRLMDEVRRRMRLRHYSLRTEQAYAGWIRRYIRANGLRHPRDMGGPEVERFLSQLATEGGVSAGTQNQALSALLFLYREVLQLQLPWLDQVVRAKRPRRVPTVLPIDEARRLLAAMDGRPLADRQPALRHRHALDGMPAPAREGCGLCPRRDHDARGQG